MIKFEKNDSICILTIDRPPMNTLNKDVIDDLKESIHKIKGDPDLRAVIITGAGEKAFAAGAEISEFLSCDEEQGALLIRKGQQIFDDLENLSVPVICAINGYALGAGLELALACDIRIIENHAQVGLPEVGLGIIPGYGGTQRLSRLIGGGKAKELIFTGRYVDAEEAKHIGIVEKVVEIGESLKEAMKLAETISQKAPLAIAAAKQSINEGKDLTLREGINVEAELCSKLFGTMDLQEGASAFLERRKAKFIGR